MSDALRTTEEAYALHGPSIGVDVRGIHQFVPHTEYGISTVDIAKRQKDANFYEGMAMTSFERDPLNENKQIEERSNIMDELRKNLQEANASAVIAIPQRLQQSNATNLEPVPKLRSEVPTIGPTFFRRLSADIKTVNFCNFRECRDLLQRDNRFEYIIAFFLFFVIISFIIHHTNRKT